MSLNQVKKENSTKVHFEVYIVYIYIILLSFL